MSKLKTQSFAKIPNDYVTVERSRGLTLLEEKLVYMLINSMQKKYESIKRLDKIDCEFIGSDIMTFDNFITTMQIGSVNRKEISEAIRPLLQFCVGIITPKVDNFMVMFKQFIVNYETNTINYKFNECFIEYFTGICRNYFMLSVDEVISLHSTYAIRIYQILKTKQNMDKQEFIYTLAELKQFLNIGNKYKQYGHFKQFVLEIAKEQINSSSASQFNIDFEEIKTGRAVTSIKFFILKKGQFNYYQQNNLLPNYQLDKIKKECTLLIKTHDKNDILYVLSERILLELKSKSPARFAVLEYYSTIERVRKDRNE